MHVSHRVALAKRAAPTEREIFRDRHRRHEREMLMHHSNPGSNRIDR